MSSSATTLTWSQKVTVCMIADGRSGAGTSGVLDLAGLGIPGGTVASLRRRGLIERATFFGTEWALTAEGHALAEELMQNDEWRSR